MPHRQTTEYSATQLLSSIQFKLSHAMFCAYSESRKPFLCISFALRLSVLITLIIKMFVSLFSNILDLRVKLLISISIQFFCQLSVAYIRSPQPRPKNWCGKFWAIFDPRLIIINLFIAISKFSTNPCKRGHIQIFCVRIYRRGQESYRCLKLSALTKFVFVFDPIHPWGGCDDVLITIWRIHDRLSFSSLIDKYL